MKPADAMRSCSPDVPQSKARHIVAECVSISLIVQCTICEAIRNNQELPDVDAGQFIRGWRGTRSNGSH